MSISTLVAFVSTRASSTGSRRLMRHFLLSSILGPTTVLTKRSHPTASTALTNSSVLSGCSSFSRNGNPPAPHMPAPTLLAPVKGDGIGYFAREALIRKREDRVRYLHDRQDHER